MFIRGSHNHGKFTKRVRVYRTRNINTLTEREELHPLNMGSICNASRPAQRGALSAGAPTGLCL